MPDADATAPAAAKAQHGFKIVSISTAPRPNAPSGARATLLAYAVEHLQDQDMAEAASEIETARMVWRKYRELVECDRFPEAYRAIYVKTYECEPEECALNLDNLTDADHQQELQKSSKVISEAWLQNGCASRILAEISEAAHA